MRETNPSIVVSQPEMSKKSESEALQESVMGGGAAVSAATSD